MICYNLASLQKFRYFRRPSRTSMTEHRTSMMELLLQNSKPLGIPEKWDPAPKDGTLDPGSWGGTLSWDSRVGHEGRTLRWETKVGARRTDFINESILVKRHLCKSYKPQFK